MEENERNQEISKKKGEIEKWTHQIQQKK
jgi:hypothetical protein